MHHDEVVAVLLLSRTIHGDAMELVYLGISPQARGHGLGDHLMRVAAHRVIERKIHRMTLAVDAQKRAGATAVSSPRPAARREQARDDAAAVRF